MSGYESTYDQLLWHKLAPSDILKIDTSVIYGFELIFFKKKSIFQLFRKSESFFEKNSPKNDTFLGKNLRKAKMVFIGNFPKKTTRFW